MKLVWLMLAGGGGTLARYAVSGLVMRWQAGGFPWGTLAVNGLGSLLFGVLWSLGSERLLLSVEVRTAVLVGFAGGFTTFSTFAFETVQMLREGEWVIAAANLVAQNGLGIALLLAGLALGRLL